MKDKVKGFNTKAIHAGQKPCPVTGAHVTPIYQTSTFVFKDVDQGAHRLPVKRPVIFTQDWAAPTLTELEAKIAALEGGEAALGAASGMAAISTALVSLLKQGDHIVLVTPFTAALTALSMNCCPMRIEVTMVDTSDINNIEQAMKTNTKVVYVETPANQQ